MVKSLLTFSFLLLLFDGCCSTQESTKQYTRDTVIVFQPVPIKDTVRVEGSLPSGLRNASCDTLAILERYGSFTESKIDSGYFWKVQWDAVRRKLIVLENRVPITKVIPIESYYSEHKVIKRPLMETFGIAACGAVAMLGIGLVLKAGRIF